MTASSSPARKATRRGVVAVLHLLPLALLEPLRGAYARSRPDGTRHRLLRRVLDVVRLRSIDGRRFDVNGARFEATSSQILQRVYWLGAEGYEAGESSWWVSFCTQANKILEVGANVGYYTVQGAKAASTTPYLAVEAHPKTAAALRKNVELNHLDNVRVIEAAAVAVKTSDTVDLQLPDADDYVASTGAYVDVSREGAPRPAAHHVTVPTMQFSDLLDGVDLIKLDIEGAEHALLESVDAWLRDQRPTMFIELLPGSVHLRRLIMDLVTSVGYRAYALGEAGPIPLGAAELRTVDLRAAHGTWDLIITPPELDELRSTDPDRSAAVSRR